MTDTKNHTSDSSSSSLQGRVFSPQSLSELADAIESAFDYRGDVSVALRSGEVICGYLFNREVNAGQSWIEIFPSSHPEVRRVQYDEVATIAFTGEDTASGKSWDAWVTKKESERKLDAARLASESQARGHL
jgi:hypothetical protein